VKLQKQIAMRSQLGAANIFLFCSVGNTDLYRSVVLKVGGIHPLGAILRDKGTKN